MLRRKLGSSTLEASVVGLGAWAIGGGPWWGPTDDAESIRAIHAALDAGINLIDTAPVYGFGHSEEVVGRAIEGRRDQVVLATKCGLWWQDATGAPFFDQDGKTVRRSLDPRTIRLEVEQSLRRLGTDYLDLLQTHWPALPPYATPIAETMACLMDLKKQGKVRAIGASNVTTGQMEEYRKAGVLDVCQPRYSLLDRRIEADVLPFCSRHNVGTLVYSPLEQGLLTGRIGLDHVVAEADVRQMCPWYAAPARKRVLAMLAGWKDLTDRYQCTLGQLVIAWTVRQSGVTVALCGARKAANAVENAGAGDLELTRPDMARMRKDAEGLGKPDQE